ncbi:hypothetical protein BGW38_010015, partial [Lunasporangiospora selenospora]
EKTLAQEVVQCFRNAVREAWSIKTRCQQIIAFYLDKVLTLSDISGLCRQVLNSLCPRVTSSDIKKTNGGEVDNGNDADVSSDGATGKNGGFFFSFMTALYSGNCPRKTDVVRFIDRLRHFGILKSNEIGPPGIIHRRTDGFQAKSTTRSVSSQLSLEI